jgi:branched-subunit amino acid transport protein
MSVGGDWVAWATVAAGGVVTLVARASFIVLPAGTRVPGWLQRGLKFVAAAVLPALILPDVLYRDLSAGATVNIVRIAAMAVAIVVALKTKNIFATMGAGMVVMWILKLGAGL